MKLGTPRLTGYRCGVRFFGENGDWISTCRGTTAIPEGKRVDTAYKAKADFWRNCEANRKELITGEPKVKVVHNPFNHHRPWFLGMRSRQDTNVTVEEANVSTISCILGYHAMNEAGRTIGWDPEKRVFTNPDDQKRLYSCFERPQFAVAPIIREIRKKVGG
jgi:hypothetical protein